MDRPFLFLGLLALWVLMIALSIIVPAVTPPEDQGLTAGLNRVSLFFQFQGAAILLSLPLWWLAGQQRGAWRWLGRLPGAVAVTGVAALIALYLWVMLARPAP